MFGSILNPFKAVENLIDVGSTLLTFELPSQTKVAQLIADGIEIATIASMFGVAEDVIMEILKK